MNCKKCNSENTIKAGFKVRSGGKVQRYQCVDCGHIFTSEGNDENKK